MTRASILCLPTLLCLAAHPVRLCAQDIPLDSGERTVFGAGVELVGAPSNAIPLLQARFTHFREGGIGPEWTFSAVAVAGLPVIFNADLGIGPTIRLGNNALIVITGGPSLVVPFIAGLRVSAGVMLKIADHVGMRLDVTRRWYGAPGAGNSIGMWGIGLNFTGLGRGH